MPGQMRGQMPGAIRDCMSRRMAANRRDGARWSILQRLNSSTAVPCTDNAPT